MKIEYNLIKEDFIEYNMYRILNSDKIKSSLLKQRYFISLDVLVVIFILLIIAGAPWKLLLFIFILIYISWINYYPRIFNNKARKNIEKMINESDNTSVFGKYILSIGKEGIIEQSQLGEAKANWCEVKKIIQTSSYFFIKVSESDTFIIPKSVFKNIELSDEFASTIEQYQNIN